MSFDLIINPIWFDCNSYISHFDFEMVFWWLNCVCSNDIVSIGGTRTDYDVDLKPRSDDHDNIFREACSVLPSLKVNFFTTLLCLRW